MGWVIDFKFHLVSWCKVYYPIIEGGLGVQNLYVFNCALLGKCLCRYKHERGLVESCGEF
jgi:hypothetical protein